MAHSDFTLTRDGNIKFHGSVVGTWAKRDIWKEMHSRNGRDISGNKLVHFVYKFQLNTGYSYDFCYTVKEMKELIQKHY